MKKKKTGDAQCAPVFVLSFLRLCRINPFATAELYFSAISSVSLFCGNNAWIRRNAPFHHHIRHNPRAGKACSSGIMIIYHVTVHGASDVQTIGSDVPFIF